MECRFHYLGVGLDNKGKIGRAVKILQDITLGQYIPIASPIHRLDPRVKFILMLLLMGVVFFITSALKFALVGLCLLLTIRFSRIPIIYVLKGLAPFLWLFIFASVFHLFLTPGESIPPFPIGIINVTREGATNGAVVTARIVCIVVLSSLLTYTTTPLELTAGLKRVLSPLSRFKIPVGDFSMMMMLTLRFVPILFLETMRIMNAQRSRGIDFESGGLFSRAKKLVPIFIPLFHLSFLRADELAIAMTCRGYRVGMERSSFRELKLSRWDTASLVAVGILIPFFFL